MTDSDHPTSAWRRRDWLFPTGLYAGLTLLLMRALLARLGSALPHDAGESALSTWILWWGGEHVPFTASWWNAPIFHPMASAMARSESLAGLLPLTAPVQFLTHSPLVAYNVAFLLSFPLCGLAAYALALEVTGRRDAALLGGLAFAFAPYRMGQLAHIQMLSCYWAPMALLGLHRYQRLGRRRWLVLFAVSWLMQGMSNASAFLPMAIVVAIWMLWCAPRWRTALPIGAAWLGASLPVVPLLFAYRAAGASLHLTANANDIRSQGLDLADFVRAPPDLAVWGTWLSTFRPDTAAFPGATVVLLGAAWVAVAWWRATRRRFGIAAAARILALLRSDRIGRAWRARSPVAFYTTAAIVLYALALGPELRLLGRPLVYHAPYAWLEALPGVDLLRVPARAAMLAVLCQSVVLACGVARWSGRPAWRGLVTAAIGVGLLADGWIRLPVVAAPAAGPIWADVSAVVELPLNGARADLGAVYRSMFHRRPVVNGDGGASPPPHYLPLVHALGERQYSVLHELTPNQPLGIAVDLSSSDAAGIVASLGRVDGIDRRAVSGTWATFVVRPRPRAPVRVGPLLAARAVTANRNGGDVARMADGSVDTAWNSGAGQSGDEDVIVDLGGMQSVGAVVSRMGAFAFGFPRALEIDSSPDGGRWTSVWGGPTAVQTVAAAVSAPETVPLTIDLGLVTARFLRFRQSGREPGIPWWIADLEIHAPAPAVGGR